MNMQEFKIFKDQNNSNLKFDFSLKNLNWMNIGGSAKVFFKPENLKELISLLKIVPKYKKHILYSLYLAAFFAMVYFFLYSLAIYQIQILKD